MTVLLPVWMQSGSYSAELDRRIVPAFGAPLGANSMSALPGVLPGVGGELNVTALGTPSMSINVASGMALVSGTYSGMQGTYVVSNDGTVNVGVSPANGSNPRIDLLVLEVLDASYSGSSNLAQLRLVPGTPSGTPTVPILPASSIPLAQIRVNANATSIASTSVTSARTWSGARGEPIRCTSTTRPANPYLGMQLFETDKLRTIIWTGTYWFKTSGQGARQAYDQFASTQVIQNGAAEAAVRSVSWTPVDGVYGPIRTFVSVQCTSAGSAAGYVSLYLGATQLVRTRYNTRGSGGHHLIPIYTEAQSMSAPGTQTLKVAMTADSASADVTVTDVLTQAFW